MPKAWVTRSKPGAIKSAAALQAKGFDPVIAPLLEITVPEEMPSLPPEDVFLIITSQNALKSLVNLSAQRHWTLICVGDATASLAKDCGFENVHSARGTSRDVTEYVKQIYAKSAPVFWHLSGNHVRGSIVEDLNKAGFTAERHVVYESRPVTTLPDINVGEIDFVLLYSPLAAKTLSELRPDTGHMVAISLSVAVDEALKDLPFKGRFIASEPTEAALITALDCAP